jgi:hypothetical protein
LSGLVPFGVKKYHIAFKRKKTKAVGVVDAELGGGRLWPARSHDADLADEHFGRTEALGIDRLLDGWNKQGMANEEVLRRSMEMIEGLYNGIR